VSAEDFDPVNYVKTNTIGVLNILKWCVENEIPKFIHVCSHRSVISNWLIGKEDAPYNIDHNSPFAEFAVSEMAAIEMINCYRVKRAVKGVILRIPSVFGYGPHLEGYQDGKYQKTGFQIFIENAMSGKSIEIWGNPKAARDIIYVKDVVGAIIKAMISDQADGLYNIASGKLLSLEDEVHAINLIFSPGKPKKIIYRPKKPNGIESCAYNIDKARKDLDWMPLYSFRQMLVDYKKEMNSGRFKFLVDMRKQKHS
jgi:UDP-glucose 4-epimerase